MSSPPEEVVRSSKLLTIFYHNSGKNAIEKRGKSTGFRCFFRIYTTSSSKFNPGIQDNLMNRKHQYTLCVTCSPGVFLSCKKLYPETKYIRFALGVHSKEITEPEKSIHEFNVCLHQEKYIGEIGLDYSDPCPSRDTQLYVFRHIIKRQAERNMLART